MVRRLVDEPCLDSADELLRSLFRAARSSSLDPFCKRRVRHRVERDIRRRATEAEPPASHRSPVHLARVAGDCKGTGRSNPCNDAAAGFTPPLEPA
jgi:hypothetical protein